MALDLGYDGNSFRMPDVLEREQVARALAGPRVGRLGSEHAIPYLQLRLDRDSPAYRRFRIAPVPGGDLTWARARLESPYGPIESEWHITADERFELQVTVPPGTAAEIQLLDGRVEVAGPGQWRFN
jgi:hypothetical protein